MLPNPKAVARMEPLAAQSGFVVSGVLPDYAASGSIRATMLKFNGTVRNISS